MDDKMLMGVLAGMQAELSKLGGMEAELSKLGGMQAELSKLGGMQAELTKLGGMQAEMSVQLTTLANDMIEVRKQTMLVPQIMSKLERVDDQLTRISDDIEVAMAASEHEHRVREADRDEIRGVGNLNVAMRRQIVRLRTDVDELKKRLPDS